MTHHRDFDQWVEPKPLRKYVPAAQARVAFWRGWLAGMATVGLIMAGNAALTWFL